LATSVPLSYVPALISVPDEKSVLGPVSTYVVPLALTRTGARLGSTVTGNTRAALSSHA
jgi:hypothetical protein